MPFGSPGQKFPLAGMNFEGHQGMGGSAPGGMASSEMVMYSWVESWSECGGSVCVYWMLANLWVELLWFKGTEAILCLKVYKLGVDGLFVDPSVGRVFLIPVVILYSPSI